MDILPFHLMGNNNLVNTNNLKTKITNNLSFNSFNKISNFGFVNNINLHLKNLNVVAKNDSLYKSRSAIKFNESFRG